MTIEALKKVMDETGLYYDPDHPDYVESKKKNTLAPPFIEFELEKKSEAADNVDYFSWSMIYVRVYTDVGDKAEKTVEDVLKAHEMFYTKDRSFLPEMGIWEAVYTMEEL